MALLSSGPPIYRSLWTQPQKAKIHRQFIVMYYSCGKLQNDRGRSFELPLGKEEGNGEIGIVMANGIASESTPGEKE